MEAVDEGPIKIRPGMSREEIADAIIAGVGRERLLGPLKYAAEHLEGLSDEQRAEIATLRA